MQATNIMVFYYTSQYNVPRLCPKCVYLSHQVVDYEQELVDVISLPQYMGPREQSVGSLVVQLRYVEDNEK